MRVTSALLRRLDGEALSPVGPSGRRSIVREGALLLLRDELGHTGYGEASPMPGYSTDDLDAACAAITAALPALTAGPLPESLEDIDLGTCGGAARFALETALLDLLSRRRSVPARALLGEARAVSISGYAGAACDASLLSTAHTLLEDGHGTLKVKVGGGSFSAERGAIARLRGELGDEWTLRLDANGAWSLDEARANLESLASYDVNFIEQPVASADLLSLGECAIPWAADEGLLDPTVRARLFDPNDLEARRGCVAVVLKPALLGGLLACRALAAKAVAVRLGVAVTHLFDGPVALAACRALARSLCVTPLASGLGAHPGLAAWPPHDFPRGPWVIDDDGQGLDIDGLE